MRVQLILALSSVATSSSSVACMQVCASPGMPWLLSKGC